MKKPLSYLGPDVEIEGTISCEGPVRIDGVCWGTIDSTDSLTVGTDAEIHGTVRAQTLVINGQIEGDLITSDSVAILSQGDIKGKIFVPSGGLSIAQGGVFQGDLNLDQLPELPPLEKLIASSKGSEDASATDPEQDEYVPKGNQAIDSKSTSSLSKK